MCLLVNNKPKKNPICSFFLIHRSINSTKGNIFLVVTKRGFKLYREHKIAPFHFPEKRKHFKFEVHWDCQLCLFFSLSLHALTWTAVSPCYSPLPCLPVCQGLTGARKHGSRMKPGPLVPARLWKYKRRPWYKCLNLCSMCIAKETVKSHGNNYEQEQNLA